MSSTNAPPDKLFLIAVVAFGLVVGGLSARWLTNGDIAFGGKGSELKGGRVTAQIPGDHLLYYPICTAWALLSVAMLTMSALAYFQNDPLFLRLSAYSLLAAVLVTVATFVTALLVKPG